MDGHDLVVDVGGRVCGVMDFLVMRMKVDELPDDIQDLLRDLGMASGWGSGAFLGGGYCLHDSLSIFFDKFPRTTIQDIPPRKGILLRPMREVAKLGKVERELCVDICGLLRQSLELIGEQKLFTCMKKAFAAKRPKVRRRKS